MRNKTVIDKQSLCGRFEPRSSQVGCRRAQCEWRVRRRRRSDAMSSQTRSSLACRCSGASLPAAKMYDALSSSGRIPLLFVRLNSCFFSPFLFLLFAHRWRCRITTTTPTAARRRLAYSATSSFTKFFLLSSFARFANYRSIRFVRRTKLLVRCSRS